MTSLPVEPPVRAWGFDEFLQEGRSLIPAHAPEWTNHNVSDPGITLVELFAYLSEILAYRALRVTPDSKLHFLRLLEGGAAGSEALLGVPMTQLDEAIRARVQALSHARCAVTPVDFEQAAQEAAARHFAAHRVAGDGRGHATEIVRTLAVAGRDLRRAQVASGAEASDETAGDISVILAPEHELGTEELQRLCRHVQHELAARCLLTTRVHVVGPVYLHVFVGCRLALNEGVNLAEAGTSIEEALRRRFGPARHGEPLDEARPFGRALHLSEVTEVIDRSEGVDWVDEVTLQRIGEGTEAGIETRIGLRIGSVATVAEDTRLGGVVSMSCRRLLRDDEGEVTSLLLHPWELVRLHLAPEALVRIGDDAAGDRR